MLPTTTVRLTTNAPIAYIADEVLFEIDEPIYLVLMPDERYVCGGACACALGAHLPRAHAR